MSPAWCFFVTLMLLLVSMVLMGVSVLLLRTIAGRRRAEARVAELEADLAALESQPPPRVLLHGLSALPTEVRNHERGMAVLIGTHAAVYVAVMRGQVELETAVVAAPAEMRGT